MSDQLSQSSRGGLRLGTARCPSRRRGSQAPSQTRRAAVSAPSHAQGIYQLLGNQPGGAPKQPHLPCRKVIERLQDGLGIIIQLPLEIRIESEERREAQFVISSIRSAAALLSLGSSSVVTSWPGNQRSYHARFFFHASA